MTFPLTPNPPRPITGFQIDYSPIRYSYAATSLSESSATLGYAYGSQCSVVPTGQFEGFRAGATQGIVNNLPQWMHMRQDQTTRGWKLMNSWGQNLDDVVSHTSTAMAEIYLETSDESSRNQLYYTDITRSELFEDKLFDNFLLNSDFSYPDVARTKLPAGWFGRMRIQKASLDRTKGLLGSHSVKLEGGGVIGQIVPGGGNVEALTASVYAEGTADVSIFLSVEKMDGTSVSSEKRATPSSSEWTRIKNTISINDTIFRVQVTFKAHGTGTTNISASKLEQGDIATNWTKSFRDHVPYISSSSVFNSVQVYGTDVNQEKVTVHPVTYQSEFVKAYIPTRLEQRNAISKELSAYGTQSYGRKVNFFNDSVPTEWVVEDGKIEERSLATKFDVFERYTIRDVRYYQEGEFGTADDCFVTITPLASAVRKGFLFVACREDYVGETFYTLKVMRPLPPPGGETYLESIRDFDLKLPFDTTYGYGMEGETISSIGFSDVDSSWLVINTTAGRRIFYKMHFDYYYFDDTNRRMFFLENYAQEGGQIQVI